MKRRTFIALAAAAATIISVSPIFAQSKEIVYLAPALDVPFWRTVAKGVEAGAKEGGYTFPVSYTHLTLPTNREV